MRMFISLVRFIYIITSLITLVIWVPGNYASAQESLPSTLEIDVPPEDTKSEIQAIPLEAVPDRAAKTITQLNSLLPGEDLHQTLIRIESEFDSALPEIMSRLEETRKVLVGLPGGHIRQDLEAKNRIMLEKRLRPWIKELDEELAKFQIALNQIDTISSVWAATDEIAQQKDVTIATVARISVVRSEVDNVRSKVKLLRNQFLFMRDQLTESSSALEDILGQLQSASEAQIKEIFKANQIPLWNPQVRESLRKEWMELTPKKLFQHLQMDTREQESMLSFQLAIFVALALSLLWLRTRVRTAQSEKQYDLQNAKEVFEVPWAMALLITVIFTTPLQLLGTSGISIIVVLLSAVAILSIIRRFLVPFIAPLVLGLMTIAVFDRVALELLVVSPTLERIVFLVEMIGALSFLFWFLHSHRRAEISQKVPLSPLLQLLGPAMYMASVALGFAIVADLIGWVDLARVIRTGIMGGGYASIGVFVLLLVFQSLVTFALLFWPLRLLRIVSRNRQLIRQRIEWVLKVLAVCLWIALVLRPLSLLDPMIDGVVQILRASASIGALSVSLGDVMVFAFIVWVSLLLARFVNFILWEDVFTRIRTGRGVPQAVSSLARYTLIVIGFFVALAAAGIELTKLSIIAGGLGVGIGFGLQNVVNNFVSGLILLFERPIGVGDIVELPEIWGEVKRIGIRASLIRKFDGSEVIVPNGMLVSDKVTNWTLSDKYRRIELDVGVEYGTPAQQVIDLLVEVAKSSKSVISDLESRAYFMKFGDSALEFRLLAWVMFEDGYSARSELAVSIQEALKQAGIGVPFPQRDLHLVSVSPKASSELNTRAYISPHLTPSSGSDKES
ncbi:MAG: mechanosensitive ion channel [Nitrosomonadales bacterium]|nr:MAG: mechanosensitive ion channel [Nitrosomonadales bacterium]